jgi:hypothetical protein
MNDPDCFSFEVRDSKGLKIQVVNLYNERDKQGVWTVDRCLYNLPLLADSVIVGDFNTRHQSWDVTSTLNSAREDSLYSWIEDNNLRLHNAPGVGTFFRSHMQAPSVIDLTLTKGRLSRQELNWHTIEIGSDHLAIGITIPSNPSMLKAITDTPAYDTRKADWDLFRSHLLREASELPKTQDLELLATSFSNAISSAAKASIPKSRKSPYSKPWWTAELRELRKSLAKGYKALHTADNENREAYSRAYFLARNSYFLAIKKVKRDYWNLFLEKTDPKSIFKAMSYTKPSSQGLIPTIEGNEAFNGKCKAFRKTLFPKPPPDSSPVPRPCFKYNWDWLPVSTIELEQACSSTAVKGKRPGPDGITQEIIAKAFQAIPDTFLKVYGTLIDKGYHPKC